MQSEYGHGKTEAEISPKPRKARSHQKLKYSEARKAPPLGLLEKKMALLTP